MHHFSAIAVTVAVLCDLGGEEDRVKNVRVEGALLKSRPGTPWFQAKDVNCAQKLDELETDELTAADRDRSLISINCHCVGFGCRSQPVFID